MRKVVILGNGVAGVTAALHLRKSCEDPITVVSAETRHFFSRPALMYIYMGHMRFEDTKPYEDGHWMENRIELVRERVERIDFPAKALLFPDGRRLTYDTLVLATGSRSNKFGWPGQDLKGVQGLYGYPDVLEMEENTRNIAAAVVVGGGLIGVELAEMLRSRGIHVTFLVRERNFWDSVLPVPEAELVARHIREHGVDLRLGAELGVISGDGNGRVARVTTRSGEDIPCGFVGLAVGVSPNIDFLRRGELETDRGILVDEYFRTNLPDVYAIGDCAQFRKTLAGRRPVEQVWYTAKMHGEFLARNLAGPFPGQGTPVPYAPGIWFNSAKFFDIEYQTYGSVPARSPAGEEGFYWEHPDGKKAVRIHFRKADGAVLGFNFLGIRARHRICERWIAEKKDLEYVLRHLGALNFEPEFSRGFEAAILGSFNAGRPVRPLHLETSKGLFTRMARTFLPRRETPADRERA